MQAVHCADGLFSAVNFLKKRKRKISRENLLIIFLTRGNHFFSFVWLTRKRPVATPTPSSNSRTKPSTKEAGCGCQATVIELFSALQSSARILGTPGAVKNSAQQNIQIQLHPVYCCQPRHLFKVGVASDRTAYNTIVCPRVLLVFPFFLGVWSFITLQLFPVNQNLPLRAWLACQAVCP